MGPGHDTRRRAVSALDCESPQHAGQGLSTRGFSNDTHHGDHVNASGISVERRRRAHQLRAQGLSQRAIAADLGVSQPAVHRYLSTPPPAPERYPLDNPSELGKCDQSGINTLGWGSCTNPTYDALVQLSPYAQGVSPLVSQPAWESSWDVLDSRYDQPLRCWCCFSLIRWSPSLERIIWRLMSPDDEDNKVRPLIRCPQHNGEVRGKYVRAVKQRPVNPQEVFRYLFTDVRHAMSAVEYARRQEIPYIKAGYKLTFGRVWLAVAAKPITKRIKSKERAYELAGRADETSELLDWALQVIDPMVRVTGGFDWALQEDDLERREPDTEFETVRGSGWIHPSIQVATAIGREVEYGDRVTRDEWDVLKKALEANRK